MSDISTYTEQIRTARYGEEVRGSIVNALEAMSDDITDDTASAQAYANAAASDAATVAETATSLQSTLTQIESDMADYDAAETARASAESARVTAETARQEAETEREDTETGYVAQCRTYANQAAQHASSDNAVLSESWAIGGTGTRYNEDSNNSKYWAELAAEVVTEGGVASFNGRTGNVTPESGDYTSTLITHGTGTVSSALTSFDTTISALQSSLSYLQNVINHGSGTYTSQEYVTETAYNRLRLYQFAGTRMGFLVLNLQISSAIPESTYITIGTLPVTLSVPVNFVATPQTSGNGNLLINISSDDGTVKIYAPTSGYTYTGFYRTIIPVVLPYATS